MEKMQIIEKDCWVSLQYKMYIPQDDGAEELWEQTPKNHPLVYCHGNGMMLPAFEAALEGKSCGDSFDFVIPHEQAYGEYDEKGIRTLAKKQFCDSEGEFDSERVVEGGVIPMRTEDGQVINATVMEITDDSVTIDLNHPYAGDDLHFTGTVERVRRATDEELEELHRPRHCCGGCGKKEGGNCKKGNECKKGNGNCGCE